MWLVSAKARERPRANSVTNTAAHLQCPIRLFLVIRPLPVAIGVRPHPRQFLFRQLMLKLAATRPSSMCISAPKREFLLDLLPSGPAPDLAWVLSVIKQAEKEQAEKIARIDAIDAQVTYTAMMTDTLMVEETTESTDSTGSEEK